MDYSTKVKSTTTAPAARATGTGQSESRSNNRRVSEIPRDGASSPLTSDQQDTGAYPCPACPIVVTTSRDLTNHLRGHNSPRSTDYSGEDDYTCGVCHKVLSSASSLDRHVLVHSGERPFKCKYCDMAFTTNGNMNRHLRTAHATSPRETNGYTDSEGSSDSEKSASKRRHRNNMTEQQEYNNNDIGKRISPDMLNQRESPTSFVGKRKRSEFTDDIDVPPRKHNIMLGNSLTEMRNGDVTNENRNIVHSCPVCGRLDFSTSALLESHLERHHPEYPAKCEPCNLSFKNHRVLNLHKYMKHIDGESSLIGNNGRNLRNSVVGFHDLTFVDFSSDKFPTIARAVCEQSLHRPATGELTKFQCDKCLRAFPCRSALDSHEIDCGTMIQETGVYCHNHNSSRRDDFFAGLDLQNRAALNEAKEGKDLADIQSIISVTSGPILQNFPRSDASTPDHQRNKITSNTAPGSSGSSGTPSSTDYHQEEEAQDAFAAEFRRMKLKGEFPCRLCDAVFPNLRALKGHNRSHMGVGPGMPYPCNMCPYTSNDKGTLVRHLRSHNGDRPFECSLCNFAFTTKANCERHVRNRHGKASRDEIKSVIIYHPSEDSTNDAGSLDRSESSRCTREDARKSLVYSSMNNDRDENSQRRKDFYMGIQFGNKQTAVNGELSNDTPPISLQSMRYDKSEYYSSTPRHSIYPLEMRMLDDEEGEDEDDDDNDEDDYDDYDYEDNDDYATKSETSAKLDYGVNARTSDDEGIVSLVNDTKMKIHQRVQPSPIDLKKTGSTPAVASVDNIDNCASVTGEDAPLDLSMDVLDLSKKSTCNSSNSSITVSTSAIANSAKDEFGRNQKEFYDATNQFLLTQALLKAGQAGNPATSLEALYANAHMIYRNFGGFSAAGVGAGILPPYLFNPHMFGQDFAIKDRLQKELVRGLQLTSGGNIVEPSIANTAFAGAYPPTRDIPGAINTEQHNDYAKIVTSKLSTKLSTGASMREQKIDNSQSGNSVKMVIKNGVLMPKQKQRRYRTERPFTCEHCSARFTLRSNMERHIKQQHPQHWSQRPRGGHTTRGRPPANPPSLLSTSNHPNNLSINHQFSHHTSTNVMPKIGQSSGPSVYEKHSISDQVKYAILAQQLKGNKNEENDTDEELVIDEAAAHENREIADSELITPTTSLLRGKLEGMNNFYRDNTRQQQQQHQRQHQHQNVSESVKKMSPKVDEGMIVEENDKIVVKSNEEENCRRAEIKIEPMDYNEERENKDPSEASVPGHISVTEITKNDKPLTRDVNIVNERNEDLASVSELLDNASQQYQQFQPQYMSDEEGLVASTSDCNNSGSDEKSDSVNSANSTNSTSSKRKKKKKKKMKKKKSAYSMAPNRVICPYCERPFPWTSSLRRHILTHTGQKPYQCMHCSLLFTTKSNCDRHLLRKHKNNANKIRRMRNSSSPETLEQPSNNNNNINNNNNNNNNSSNSAFAMRNVPERPYKCNLCPSSTFSTLGNLKKHKSSKHSRNDKSRAESPVTSESRNSPITTCNKQNEHSGYDESQSSSVSENMDHVDNVENLENQQSAFPTSVERTNVEARVSENVVERTEITDVTTKERENLVNLENSECIDIADNSMLDGATTKNHENNQTINETGKSRRQSPRSSPGPADQPFKCHLCEYGFSERHDCLSHIRINHKRSYEILLAKGALDMDIETPEEQQPPPEDGDEKRGKFPDYSNRKVVCAFCMRRFWSAEDLRRHMRTHTGERPFSCDICARRFTLKHSMLRHRKKHESVDSMMYVGTSGDEEPGPSQPPTITPRSQQQQHSSILPSTSNNDSRIHERIALPTVATVATGDAAGPSGLMKFNHYDNITSVTGEMTGRQQNFNANDCPADTENDLISNLLGIRDKSIIDKVLQASADDAAKLLGVNRHHD